MNTFLYLAVAASLCSALSQAGITVPAVKNLDKKLQTTSKADPKKVRSLTESTSPQTQEVQSLRSDNTLNIAIVNLSQAIGQLLETKEIEQELNSEDQAKRKELEELALEAKKLQEELNSSASMLKSDAVERKRERIMEIQRTIELRAQNYEQARQRKTQEIQMRIFKDVEHVAEQIRQEMHIDIIMAGSVLAYNPKLDITHTLVERMNTSYTAKKAPKKASSKA